MDGLCEIREVCTFLYKDPMPADLAERSPVLVLNGLPASWFLSVSRISDVVLLHCSCHADRTTGRWYLILRLPWMTKVEENMLLKGEIESLDGRIQTILYNLHLCFPAESTEILTTVVFFQIQQG